MKKREHEVGKDAAIQRQDAIFPKSKLATLRESLQANPEVYYAGELIRPLFIAPVRAATAMGDGREEVEIFVAPITPIFEPEALDNFMQTLVRRSGIDWDNIYRGKIFGRYNNQEGGTSLVLTSNSYSFREVIGKRETTIAHTITDPDTRQRVGKISGTPKNPYLIVEEYIRNGLLKVYPDPITARHLYAYALGRHERTVELDDDYEKARGELNPRQIAYLQEFYRSNPNPDPKQLQWPFFKQ